MQTWKVGTYSAKARCNGVKFNLFYAIAGSTVKHVVWPEQAKAQCLPQ